MNNVLTVFLMVMLMCIVALAFEQGFEVELDNASEVEHDSSNSAYLEKLALDKETLSFFSENEGNYASLVEASKGTYSPELLGRVQDVLKAHDLAMGLTTDTKPAPTSPASISLTRKREAHVAKTLEGIDMEMRLAPNTKRIVIEEGERLVKEFDGYVSQFNKEQGKSNCPESQKEKEKEKKDKKKKDSKAAKKAEKKAEKKADKLKKSGPARRRSARRGGKKSKASKRSSKKSKRSSRKTKRSSKRSSRKSKRSSRKSKRSGGKRAARRAPKRSSPKKHHHRREPKPDVITKTVYKTRFVKLPCTKGNCIKHAPPAPTSPPFFPPPFPPEKPIV